MGRRPIVIHRPAADSMQNEKGKSKNVEYKEKSKIIKTNFASAPCNFHFAMERSHMSKERSWDQVRYFFRI